MLAITRSAVVRGIEGSAVTVEVHVGNGLPAFCVVGLPDTSCRESRDRVMAALRNAGLNWLRHQKTDNIAATLRSFARKPLRLFRKLGYPN